MTRSPALSDDLGHLVDLSLGTAEGTESLLGQLSRTLVLAVTEKFDDTALVWGEAVEAVVLAGGHLSVLVWASCGVPRNLLHDIPNESSPLAQVALHARDTRLWLARGDFLYGRNLVSPPSNSTKFPSSLVFARGWEDAERRTWPALRPTAMPDFCLTSCGMVGGVVDGWTLP